MAESPARGGLFLSRNRLLIFAALLIAFVAVQWQWPRLFGPTPPEVTDTLIWYPTLGKQNPDGSWRIRLRGRAVEVPESADAAAVRALRARVPPAALAEGGRLGTFRLREMAARGLPQRQIVIRFGLRHFRVGDTDDTGAITGAVDVPSELIGDGRTWRFQTLLRKDDARKISGVVHLLKEQGWSVLSCIDQTIRISAGSPEERTRRAWQDPHEAVPGMAKAFRGWERTPKARFHYFADRPWATFAETRDFLFASRFPAGSVHLRPSAEPDLPLIRSRPAEARAQKFSDVIARFPQRGFVLVGSAVENDLETFAILAKKHPQQIRHIFLRTAKGAAPLPKNRVAAASAGLPEPLNFRFFTTPDTLPALR